MVAAQVSADDRSRLYRKVALRLLPLLFVGYLVANLDRNNVAFAKLGFLPELGFGETVFGLGASLFYLGYVLCEIPSNLMIGRIGARLTIVRIMALWFVASLAAAFIVAPWHYYIVRFVLGASEAGYLPGVLYYLAIWVPRSRRAGFTAVFMLGIPVSGVIGAPIAGAVMQGLDGVMNLSGWRWLFIIEAVPALILAAVFFRYLLDSPAQARWLNDDERRLIVADLSSDIQPAATPRRGGETLAALRNPAFYLIGVQAFGLMAGLNGLNLWAPTIFKKAGVAGVGEIALFVAAVQAAGVVAMLALAWSSDRTGERRLHTVIPLLVAASGWLLMPMLRGQATGALVCLILVSAGVFGATAPFWSIPAQYLSRGAAPVGIAMTSTMGALGAWSARSWSAGSRTAPALWRRGKYSTESSPWRAWRRCCSGWRCSRGVSRGERRLYKARADLAEAMSHYRRW